MSSAITTQQLVKKASLSVDQADLVQELLASKEAYAAYLKLVRRMVELMESEVVSMSSSSGAEALFHAKLKAEGARKIYAQMEGLVTHRQRA